MTTTTGAIRRNGTEAPSALDHENGRRRRDRGEMASAATAELSGTGLLNELRVPSYSLRLVEGERDVVARHRCSLLDRHLVREDPREHGAEDVSVLHVDPV